MTQTLTGFVVPPQSFFRTTPAGNLPDGTNDTTENIRRLGAVGIGGASQAEAIPVVAGASATNDILHLSSAAANRGQLFFGSNPLSYYLERPLSAVANQRVDIGTIAAVTTHAYTLRVSVSTATGGISQTRIYKIPISYHITTNVVRIVVPDSVSILAGDTNAFELLLRVNTTTATLWLRRTAGAVATTYRVRVELIGDGSQVLTEAATAVVDAAVYTPIDFRSAPTTNDFWRSNAGTLLPDGTTDTADAIQRTGSVHIGGSTNAVSQVEVTNVFDATNNPTMTVRSNANSGAVGISVRASTHATSRRATISVGDWDLLQDINASGVKDFFINNSLTGLTIFSAITATSRAGINQTIPLNALHIGGAGVVANTTGIRTPITSASPNQTGSALGVNVQGDIVKIAGLSKFRVVQALAIGANVIAHNLGLATTPVMVEVRDNATGALITASVTVETANSTTINVAGAVAAARITIIG